MEEEIKPVFVIGAARTGTTWLSNTLKDNFGLYTPSHFLHHGVKEPNLWQFQKLCERLERKQFLDLISESDNINLLVQDSASIRSMKFDSYTELFMRLMDQNAQKKGTSWFTKLDPDYFYSTSNLKKILEPVNLRYVSPRFIVIKRSFDDYLTSYINMPGRYFTSRRSSILRAFFCVLASMRYHNLYKISNSLKGQVLKVNYDDLKDNYNRELTRISDFLDLPIISHHSPAKSNFSNKTTDSIFRRSSTRLFTRLFTSIKVNSLCLLWYDLLFRRNDQTVYRRLFLLENNPNKLREQLKQSNEMELLARLESFDEK